MTDQEEVVMDIVSVTVHNSNDPTCHRLSLTHHFKVSVTEDPVRALKNAISETEKEHRESFPRGMTYNLPYVEVEITPREVLEMRAEAVA